MAGQVHQYYFLCGFIFARHHKCKGHTVGRNSKRSGGALAGKAVKRKQAVAGIPLQGTVLLKKQVSGRQVAICALGVVLFVRYYGDQIGGGGGEIKRIAVAALQCQLRTPIL
ncbi:hypothetical protein SDC9_141648 [bioreactor metagenome]|uniref:Uncharacterized protein n=1 Tax=bioreactor metagenome TaxID=1076179 RepID=A0A645E1P2_9ZZZZ